MAERNLVEQLDQAVNALLAGRPESATFDAELAGLLVIRLLLSSQQAIGAGDRR